MLDGGVGCLDQVGSGLNVAQLCGLAQGVEERGDFLAEVASRQSPLGQCPFADRAQDRPRTFFA